MNPPETSEDRDNIGGDRNFVNDDNSDNTRNNMEDVSDDRMNSDQSQGQFPFQNNNNQNLPINSVVSKDTIKNVNPFNPNDNSNNSNVNSNPNNQNMEAMMNQMQNSMSIQNQNSSQQQQMNYPQFTDDNNNMNKEQSNNANNNMASSFPQSSMENNDQQKIFDNSGQSSSIPIDNTNNNNYQFGNNQQNNNNINSNNKNNQMQYPNLDVIENPNKNNNEKNNAGVNNMNNQMNNNMMNSMKNQPMTNNNMNMSNPQNQMNNLGNNKMNNMNNMNNNQMNNNAMQMSNSMMNNNNQGMQNNNNQMNVMKNDNNNNNNNNFVMQMSNLNNNNNNQNNNMNNNNFGMPMSNMNSNNMNNNNFGMPMSDLNNQNNNMKNNFGMPMNNMNNMNNNMGNPNFSMPNNMINEGKYSFDDRYKIAPKTSLKNLGDTSYLNAVLQLFATSKDISSYFVNPKYKKYFDDNKVSIPFAYVFHRLFTHFYPYPPKQVSENYSPEVLLDVLGRYNKIYISKKSRNPNDLLIFILCTLHKELNKQKTKYISSPDPTNKNEVLKEGLNDFMKSNQSKISDNFHWFELKSKFCSGCKLKYYSFNNFETLDLDILGTFQKNNYAPISILSCLNYQSQKSQNIFCQKCQKYTQFDINTKIYSSPINFIFTLNRGYPDQNQNLLNIKFMVEEKIDIGQYLENKKAYTKFELIGIVSYYMQEKKYVCFGKSPADEKWYLYNDEKVMDTNNNEVINRNNNMEYIPCILLYQFMK